MVAKDPSLQGVLNIVLRLLPKEENEEEEEVDKSKRYYDYSSDSDEEEEYGEFGFIAFNRGVPFA